MVDTNPSGSATAENVGTSKTAQRPKGVKLAEATSNLVDARIFRNPGKNGGSWDQGAIYFTKRNRDLQPGQPKYKREKHNFAAFYMGALAEILEHPDLQKDVAEVTLGMLRAKVVVGFANANPSSKWKRFYVERMARFVKDGNVELAAKEKLSIPDYQVADVINVASSVHSEAYGDDEDPESPPAAEATAEESEPVEVDE